MHFRKLNFSGTIALLFCNFVYLNISSELAAQAIPDRPQPARFVNDYADILSQKDRMVLETKLQKFNKDTSHQLVIVIVQTLGDLPVEDYSIRLAQAWGIGQKGRDNGLLILAAMQERRLRIEVGYGLEGSITDAHARRIIDGQIVPHFRVGEFGKAFNVATDQIIKLLLNETPVEAIEMVVYEDDDAVLGGRLLIYGAGGFAFIVMLLVTFRLEGLEKLTELCTLIGIALVTFWTESVYWDVPHGIWFWIRLIFLPILVIVILQPLRSYLNRRKKAFKNLQKNTSDYKIWQSLEWLHHPLEVQNKYNHYASIFNTEHLTHKSFKRITILNKEIKSIFDTPAKYILRRSNADLLELEQSLKKSKILHTKLYQETNRRSLRDFIKEEKLYFAARSLKMLDTSDEERIKIVLKRIGNAIEDPELILGIDYAYVRGRVDAFMQGASRWKSYRSKYTQKSIARTRNKFENLYADLKKMQMGDHYKKNLYRFFKKYVQTIKSNPGNFLNRKPTPHRSSSYGSGSSSFSFSSGASSIFSSSSSFGGGSFGGGGASGSW